MSILTCSDVIKGLGKPKKCRLEVQLFSYPSIQTHVLGAQKNRLIETVHLSTHNICFGQEIRKIFFDYSLLSIIWLYY